MGKWSVNIDGIGSGLFLYTSKQILFVECILLCKDVHINWTSVIFSLLVFFCRFSNLHILDIFPYLLFGFALISWPNKVSFSTLSVKSFGARIVCLVLYWGGALQLQRIKHILLIHTRHVMYFFIFEILRLKIIIRSLWMILIPST